MSFTPRRLEDGRICCSRADALCTACEAHFAFAALEAPAPAPDPYGAPLRALAEKQRGEKWTDGGLNPLLDKQFIDEAVALQHGRDAEERARFETRDAEHRAPRGAAAAEPIPAAPDPYRIAIAKMEGQR